MIYVKCDQGSPEWHGARAGLITASMFAVARSRTGDLDERQKLYVAAIREGKPEKTAQALAGYSKAPTSKSVERAIEGHPVGGPSEAALNYAFRLAVERIGGTPLDEGFETWAMERGRELEPEARRRHEVETGQTVQRVGFAMTDDRRFGASLDGTIGEDGAAEYKCFVSPEKLRGIHIDGEIGDVRQQAQGCLWVTGRRWIDVCCYCPALSACGRDLWRQRIERDDDFIEAMEADLVAFMRLVDGYEAALRLPLAA